MTASASRDVTAKPSIITPMATKLAESMLPVMQYVGMKKLEVRKLEAGNLHRVIAGIEMFDDVPEDLKAFAMLIKDHVAAIVASTGIAMIEISADKSEVDTLNDGYERLDAMFKAAKLTSEEAEKENGNETPETKDNEDDVKSTGTDGAACAEEGARCTCGGKCCQQGK